MTFIKVLIATALVTVSTVSFAEKAANTWCPTVALLARTYQDGMKNIPFDVNGKTIIFTPTWAGYINLKPGERETYSIEPAYAPCEAGISYHGDDTCSLKIPGNKSMLSKFRGPVSKSNTCVYKNPAPYIMQLTLDRTQK